MSKPGNAYVKVFYRIFPTEKPCCDYLKVKDKTKVYLRNLQQLFDPSKAKQPPIFWEFDTDGVFFNSRQEFVYSEVMGDILEKVCKGSNGIVAAFGETGSGKSLTMAGLDLSEENLGIAPRAINGLFALKKTLPRNLRMCIQMSYAEFSKTSAVDLLKEFPNDIDAWHTKESVTKIKVKCEFDALKLLFLGEGRKSSVETENYMSHNNTSVVTFHITTMDVDFSQPRQISSRLHIIDMAGVNTLGDESCVFKDPVDVGFANLDKLNLGIFLSCLMTRNPELIKIKQRINPLMYYLGSDLSCQNIARFVGHIKILRENLPITMSLMKFGQLLRGYKPTKKEFEVELDPEYKINYLQRQLEKLHREKIQNSVLLNQNLTTNLNCDRMDHLRRTVNDFLKGRVADINVMNVADVSVVFKLFKEMCNQLEVDKHKLLRERAHHDSDASAQPKKSASKASTSMSSLRERKGSVIRRVSKKLKESPSVMEHKISVEKVEKATSVQSLVEPKSKNFAGKTDRSSGSIATLNKRKISKEKAAKTSTGNIRRGTSISKRKSTASVSTENKFLISDVHLLPDDFPENREVWKLYSNEPSYKNLVEEYKVNEGYIMAVYSNYLRDIEKLQDIKDAIENMKHDITEANVMKKFNVCTTGADNKLSESILAEAEIICKENLANAQKELLVQQETVLKSQSELKIYLNIRKDLKKQLNTDFENYCKDKFNVVIPNMKNLSEEEIVNDTKYSSEEKNIDEVGKSVSSTPQLISLKQLMKKEHMKNEKSRHLSRITWTNLPTRASPVINRNQ